MRSREEARTVGGRYALGEEIARGGMGVVWRAEDSLLGRSVAVKEIVPPAGLPSDEQATMRRRVLREARAAAALHHPGIVTVYDVILQDGQSFIVMELVDAPSLEEVVREDGPIPVERATALGRDAAATLAEAHARGIVHRDVKPGNVLLTDGHVKLADFGISSVSDDPSLTGSGEVFGSPAFMAPEQVRGERADARTDLWGLGATLYFAVEGDFPFGNAGAIPTLHAVAHEEPRPMQRAGALAPVIAALLTKDPAKRPTEDQVARMLGAPGTMAKLPGSAATVPIAGHAADAPAEPGGNDASTEHLTSNGGTTPLLVSELEAGRAGSSDPVPPTSATDPRRRRFAAIPALVTGIVLAVVITLALGGGDPVRLPNRPHHQVSSPAQHRWGSGSSSPSATPTTRSPSPRPTSTQGGGGGGNPGHEPQGNAFGHDNGNQGNGNGNGGAGEGGD